MGGTLGLSTIATGVGLYKLAQTPYGMLLKDQASSFFQSPGVKNFLFGDLSPSKAGIALLGSFATTGLLVFAFNYYATHKENALPKKPLQPSTPSTPSPAPNTSVVTSPSARGNQLSTILRVIPSGDPVQQPVNSGTSTISTLPLPVSSIMTSISTAPKPPSIPNCLPVSATPPTLVLPTTSNTANCFKIAEAKKNIPSVTCSSNIPFEIVAFGFTETNKKTIALHYLNKDTIERIVQYNNEFLVIKSSRDQNNEWEHEESLLAQQANLLAYSQGNIILSNPDNLKTTVTIKTPWGTLDQQFNSKPYIASFNYDCSKAFIVENCMLNLYDCKELGCIGSWVLSNQKIASASFSHDGNYIISIGKDYRDSIRIWDLNGNRIGTKRYNVEDNLLATIRVNKSTEREAISVVFSNTVQDMVMLATEDCFGVCNATAGTLPWDRKAFKHTQVIKKLEVSMSGNYLVTVSDESVIVWDPRREARKSLCHFTVHDKDFKIVNASLNQDNSHLVIALENGIVYDYNIEELMN